MSQPTTKSHQPIPSTSALTAQSTKPVVPTHRPQSEGISPSSLSSLPTHQLLTDVQLLRLCTHYGSQAKLWKQKFLGLLPEYTYPQKLDSMLRYNYEQY